MADRRLGGILRRRFGGVTVSASVICEIGACGQTALGQCVRCGKSICERHAITSQTRLPGAWRALCSDCDAERRRVYRATRAQGLRAIVWSGAGAIVGSLTGNFVGSLVSSNGVIQTVATDSGFVLGVGLTLFLAFRPRRRAVQDSSTSEPTSR